MITENVVINRNYSWIDIEHPLRSDFDFLKTEFGLSPLLVQDCLKPSHLPKHEETDEGHFILCRAYDPSAKKDAITVQGLTNKVAVFITKERVMTIHGQELTFLRKFINTGGRQGFPESIHGLAHQLIRNLIQTYEDPLSRLQSEYEEFEHEVLSRSTDSLSTHRVYQFRRQLFILKGMLKQTQGVLQHGKDFWEDRTSLLQDIREDIDQYYFRLDDISHNFDQLFALYISINDQRNNEVMRILTIFASILLPITFVTSFYGMNFDNLPGLHSPVGLALLILIMVLMSLVTFWYFKRKHWFVPKGH